MDGDSATSNLVKVGISWVGVGLSYLGIHTWSDMAAITTTIFTLLLICDWVRKKLRGRP